MRRNMDRSWGIPVSAKEKLRIAMLGLVKIALEPTDAKETAIKTLNVLGVKPKEDTNAKPE